ncbi:hypothetical protein [Gardnerella vaginalis]|uniref:hypothetical protein n=1 Tax=Gardnerella vaginalis TaxID=2702 RepID=UPI001FF3A5BD|nr:hypothetical protein [Gardnerella vaginalis]
MTTTNPSKHTSSSKSSRKRSAHKVHTLPLATMAALLTAATCLGSQPAMAVTTPTITTTTYNATARSLTNSAVAESQNREADVVVNNPEWLKTPSILEFQRYRATNDENKDKKTMNSDDYGSDEHNTLIKKTDMYAHIETIDGAKYLVFDVFFNNDAQSMIKNSKRQWYIWQVPYQIAKLNSNGSYASDTIRDLRFDAYKLKNPSENDKLKRKMNFTLSRDFGKFEKVDNQSTTINFPNDSEKDFGGNRKNSSSFHYSLGPNLVSKKKYETDLKNLFHGNYQDYAITKATYPESPYSGWNYGIGIQTSEVNLAFHMHAAVKLNDTAINEKATTYDEKYANIHNAWTWADSASYARTTSSSYVWISGRDPKVDQDKNLIRHKDDKEAPKIYYNGKEITNDNQTIKLYKGDKLSFTTTDNKGYIEKFSIAGLTKPSITKQGTGSESEPLSSGDIIVTEKMNSKKVIITSEDGSGNVTTRKVKVKVTTLAKEHPLSGKTIDTTVGDKLPELTEIDKFVTVKDGSKLKQQPTLEWNGKSPAPSTETVGVFTRSIKGTYSDQSTKTTDVTINVKPQKPVIDTDLTNLAGKKGQKVTVSVGSGIPTDAKVTTTVKLFDKNGNEIGSTTTINNGKAEITVNGEIPEGDVYATTNVMRQTKTINAGKITIPGFDLTSEKSDTKRATAPKDAQDPTITATAESSSVTVGQDLKIHIVAKDDVKVEEVPNANALQQGLGLDVNELSSRIKSSQTTNTDKEKDFDLTVKNMQPKEVGTHTLTFTVKDSAGKTGTTTLNITVKPAAPTVTPQNDGSVDVTPADGTDTLEITYTPEGETNEKTITVKKNNDGNWTGETPEGVTVDGKTGKVTIPAKQVKDGSDVKAKDKKGDTSSEEATGKAKDNPTTPEAKPAVPTVTPQDDGSVDVTPADGTDTLEITYTPEGETNEKTITVKKNNDGNWTGETPEGVTVDGKTGKVTIPAKQVKDGSDVKAKDKKGDTSSEEATGKAGNNGGNSGSDTGNSESGNSNGSGSDSGNDSTPNNGGSASGSTTGGSSSTDSGAQNSTNESSSADNANNAGNAETGNAGNSNTGNASTGASGSNASNKSGNKVPAKHSSQLVKTGAEVERLGLISAMIGVLGAAAAFFSRKKNHE